MSPRFMRLVGVGLLPALAFGAVVAAYELFVVPRVQIGRSVSPAHALWRLLRRTARKRLDAT